MSQTGRICATMLLAACLTLTSGAQTAPDDPVEFEDGRLRSDADTIREAHADYLRKGGLQFERPEREPEAIEPPPPPPGWLRAFARFLESLGPLFTYLFYAVAALVVLGVLYFLFGEALRVRFGGSGDGKLNSGDDVIPDFRPEASAARSLLEEADALARAGKFAEAVHLLLFRSIEDLQTRLETGVPRSLTAREIGQLNHLPTRARTALGPIIRIVERSFFGGRDVDESGWTEARASYEEFAFGGEWT